ncbi:hypothetical protein LSG31_18185 [Fodinisporobacter ferrooxydans]|uniref:Uncharacterized protein n=1 Tax=Fodinisporobacter ferrooxydans TaxID=2901836 RepID=A0ABY4CK09_9BACL|nr:hypothetical protein LSG31_18185 [Alicyclobacillaceae bacterium MYW30-H2]
MRNSKRFTGPFFRTIGFPFVRNIWSSRIVNWFGSTQDPNIWNACTIAVRQARTLDELLAKLIALGQEYEMSASMALTAKQKETYEAYLRAAGRCYRFAFQYTRNEQIKNRMQRASEEIDRRLQMTGNLFS